jgi:hypothetical protein
MAIAGRSSGRAASSGRTSLGIRWAPITKGHPWQNLAEGGVAVQRRRLDAYVVGCPEREAVYRQPAPCVQDSQCWGHWAHTRTEAQGRIFSRSPAVVLGQAHGRAGDPGRRQRPFRLRHRTRLVRACGHIRLHHFGLSGHQGRWGQPVDVLIDDDAVRVEQADRLLVSYPCVDDTGQRRITSIDARGRQQYRQFQRLQLALWTLDLIRFVWRMPPYQRRRWPRQSSFVRQISLFEPFAH